MNQQSSYKDPFMYNGYDDDYNNEQTNFNSSYDNNFSTSSHNQQSYELQTTYRREPEISHNTAQVLKYIFR